jgi:uncharacterized membrane protein YozB (DUF420 family)
MKATCILLLMSLTTSLQRKDAQTQSAVHTAAAAAAVLCTLYARYTTLTARWSLKAVPEHRTVMWQSYYCMLCLPNAVAAAVAAVAAAAVLLWECEAVE